MREFNAVVLGAGGVGKSALTCRFMRDQFVDGYDPTIEESYRRTVVVDDEMCSLEVLDTAGAEQFNAMNELYIKNGRGFILVFSLAQEISLREVDNLRLQILRVKNATLYTEKVPIVVVGTKSDLVAERQVTPERVSHLSNAWGLPFYETSAKKDWGVKEVFDDLIRQMKQHYPEEESRRRQKKRKGGKCVIM